MKILNTYYGLEAHNFNAEPYHACVRYDASDDEIAFQKDKAQKSLTNKKCFWYLVEVTTINPHTGEHSSEGFFDTVGEKAKIILNAKVQKNITEKPKATNQNMGIGDLFDHANIAWPVPKPPIPVPPTFAEFLAAQQVAKNQPVTEPEVPF